MLLSALALEAVAKDETEEDDDATAAVFERVGASGSFTEGNQRGHQRRRRTRKKEKKQRQRRRSIEGTREE